ncbi:hypothetical protein LCGC14_0342840 [marine sediment metagenome]|uniref:Uncharacterized protein n=1 Tax=marine sediment metagenome TaxID=412755 RepID=A0A0F9W0B7_9ZZZZ
MRKNDLETGFIIEYRYGDRRVVINDELWGVWPSFSKLVKYHDDLTNIDIVELDIVKVWKRTRQLPEDISEIGNPDWTREPKIELRVNGHTVELSEGSESSIRRVL